MHWGFVLVPQGGTIVERLICQQNSRFTAKNSNKQQAASRKLEISASACAPAAGLSQPIPQGGTTVEHLIRQQNSRLPTAPVDTFDSSDRFFYPSGQWSVASGQQHQNSESDAAEWPLRTGCYGSQTVANPGEKCRLATSRHLARLGRAGRPVPGMVVPRGKP